MKMKKTFAVAAGIACLSICGAAQLFGQSVSLETVALAKANMVLSPCCFNEATPEAPIQYYMNEGTELILPKKGFLLSEKNPVQKLTIRGVACDLTCQGGVFGLSVAGKPVPLAGSQLGLQTVDIPVGAKVPYRLAFPRGYNYKKEGHLFARSGVVQAGTVDGLAIRLYDDDLDGRYVKGKDGISVGDNGGIGIFAALSSVVPGATAAYEIGNVSEDGSSLTLSKFAGATGQLKVEAPKDLECRLAFASEDGKCSFGMLAGDQWLTLPAGKYRMQYGFVSRPKAGHLTALVLPSKSVVVSVGSGEKVSLAMGDLAAAAMPDEGYASMDFHRFLELDLSGVENACDAGDFAKAQQLFGAITGKYKSGPNYEVSKEWIEELRQRLVFETSPEGGALRDAENKMLAAIKADKLDEAKAQLPAVQAALAKIPPALAKSWLGLVYKAKIDSWSRFAAGTSRPGLKLPKCKLDAQSRDRGSEYAKVRTVPGDPEYVANIAWTTRGLADGYSEFSKYAGRGWIYEGFLIAPQDGEYEIALESGTGGALLQLDGKPAIDHWGKHLSEERSIKLKLPAGRHSLHIEFFTCSGREHNLYLRWTPPGGRKTIVPAWALECDK